MVDPGIADDGGQIKKILKVLVVGEMGTGKTSLIRQYVQGFFSEFYKTTIGVDFANKDFEWDEHTSISLQLWDIAGQERYGNMTHVYYQEAVAAFVVFDVTRITSLDMVTEWKKDIDSKVFTSEDKPIPCILLGNKIDLCQDGKWAKSDEEMQEFIGNCNFVQFFTTSARDGTNIDTAAKALVKYVLDNKIEPHGANEDHGVDIKVGANREAAPKGGCGC
jgi:small GTP-binding protein